MVKKNHQLIIAKDDYNILTSYLSGKTSYAGFDKKNAEELQAELKRAVILRTEELPQDVVRLNSRVRIKVNDKKEMMELMLVTPDKADIASKKISILAPVGTALIGFRKGQKVNWEMPGGKRSLTIVDVVND